MVEAAAGCKDERIIEALGVSASMVTKTRRLIAIACSQAPPGHEHWTLRLLAGKMVELGYAESFSHESVGQLLKKHP